MNDVMIDFETLGKGPNHAICQVGACYFDKVTGEIGEKFFANVDARSHERLGAKCDADTVYWWLQQSDEARNSLLECPQEFVEVMIGLNLFLKDAKRIWSHATFDFVILCNAMKQASITPTFSYKAGLDLRTLTYLAHVSPQDFPREGTHHNGLDDAVFQVKYTVAALNAIKTNKQALKFLEGLTGE